MKVYHFLLSKSRGGLFFITIPPIDRKEGLLGTRHNKRRRMSVLTVFPIDRTEWCEDERSLKKRAGAYSLYVTAL